MKCYKPYLANGPETTGKAKTYILIPQIQESITELYRNQTKYIRYNSPNGFGTTNTAFYFLSAMLILCTCYPHAICHVE